MAVKIGNFWIPERGDGRGWTEIHVRLMKDFANIITTMMSRKPVSGISFDEGEMQDVFRPDVTIPTITPTLDLWDGSQMSLEEFFISTPDPTTGKAGLIDNDKYEQIGTNATSIANLETQVVSIMSQIASIENLGHYVGSFATKAALPNNISAFPNGITVNDFTTIQADETNNNAVTRYVVSAIDSTTGQITWTYDITYSTDISGKADNSQTVATPSEGTLAKFTGTITQSVGAWLAAFVTKINEIITGLNGKQNLVQPAGNNNVATFQSVNGQVKDSGVNISEVQAAAARISQGTNVVNVSDGVGGWVKTGLRSNPDELGRRNGFSIEHLSGDGIPFNEEEGEPIIALIRSDTSSNGGWGYENKLTPQEVKMKNGNYYPSGSQDTELTLSYHGVNYRVKQADNITTDAYIDWLSVCVPAQTIYAGMIASTPTDASPATEIAYIADGNYRIRVTAGLISTVSPNNASQWFGYTFGSATQTFTVAGVTIAVSNRIVTATVPAGSPSLGSVRASIRLEKLAD
jgi:hypothetical protein